MSTFEISTCFSNGTSDLDASLCQEAVAPYLKSDLFALKTTEVFFGRRRAHTNVHITLRNVTRAEAQEAVEALKVLTGRRWNSPTQDPDEVEKEAGGKTWGMFTAEGAQKVGAMIELLEGQLRAGTLSPAEEFLTNSVELHCNAIAGEGHGEVFDTAVREEIYGQLDRVLEDMGVRV